MNGLPICFEPSKGLVVLVQDSYKMVISKFPGFAIGFVCKTKEGY